MIGNLLFAKVKRKKETLENEYANATGYKKRQLLTKLYEWNNKYFPKVFWDSKAKGTYRKKKNDENK